MPIHVSLENLDFSKAIEVISSQDPDADLRFNLPIPNWLVDERPVYEHAAVHRKTEGDKGWRYFFLNLADNCEQNVEIDGTSVITFMGAKPEQAKHMLALIAKCGGPESLTPASLTELLDRIAKEVGVIDRYDNPRKNVDSYMHPYEPLQPATPHLGPFLPVPNLSTAVYVPGEGEFADGPTSTPQKFKNGAFIVVPGKSRDVVLSMSLDELREKGSVRLIQADRVLLSKTFADGRKIVPEDLPKNAYRPAAGPANGLGGPCL